MANVFFTQGRQHIVTQTLNLTGEASLKVMLVDSTYTPPVSANFVSEGGGASATSHEISVTGYTGGFNGSGRKALSAYNRRYVRQDTTLNRLEFHFDDITWTALGATATIGGVVLIVEKTTDADSWLVAFWDTNDITTNGSDIIFAIDTTGAIYF